MPNPMHCVEEKKLSSTGKKMITSTLEETEEFGGGEKWRHVKSTSPDRAS
jgi:hypothetical protein